ncbi:MAG: FtsX-like permease family protein, partial [Prevotella sp.]|nr:FtsX-like permease family protein [Prevotella sp.]
MKSLFRYKVYALLNIIGLGIALATAYVIGVQVYYTMTYNKNVSDSERVFVLEQKGVNSRWLAYLSLPLGNAIGEKVSEVEDYGVCDLSKNNYITIYIKKDSQKVKAKAKKKRMSISAARIMGVIAEEGSLEQLADQNTIGVSRSFADRWGLKIGDSGTIGDVVYQVVCIFRDMPVNSTLSGTDVIGEFDIPQNLDNTSSWNYNFIFKLYSADGVSDFYDNAKKVGMDASRKIDGADGNTSQDGAEVDAVLSKMELRLVSMSDFYLYDGDQTTNAEHSSPSLFYAFCVVFVVILLVAFSNFINFFMALVPRRIRSINTHKVFGYSNARLRLGLILEAVVLVSISLFVAAVLVLCFIETPMSGYLNAGILFKDNVFVVCAVIVVAFVLAVVASLYPAYYITSMPPAMSFRGSFGNTSRGRRFRMSLLAFQFFVAISLIIASIFVCLQHYFMMNSDLGFNREYLMSVDTPGRISSSLESRKAFEAKLRRNPLISDMAWADGNIVAANRMGWGRVIYQDGKHINLNFQVYPVSWNFL